MADRIRLTITVTPEVHATFTRMAEAAGVSLGRAMGDWLGDTVEGAELVAQKMRQARESPVLAMREMRAMATGLVDAVDETISELRGKGQGINLGIAGGLGGRAQAEPAPAARAGGARKGAPSSNTGLKVTGTTSAKGRKT